MIQFFTTWLLIIGGLIALASSRWGKTLVYYLVWLALLLLLVTHADELSGLISLQSLQLNG